MSTGPSSHGSGGSLFCSSDAHFFKCVWHETAAEDDINSNTCAAAYACYLIIMFLLYFLVVDTEPPSFFQHRPQHKSVCARSTLALLKIFSILSRSQHKRPVCFLLETTCRCIPAAGASRWERSSRRRRGYITHPQQQSFCALEVEYCWWILNGFIHFLQQAA